MEFEKIKELMQTLDNSNLMDFELKLNDGFYLRMNKHSSILNNQSQSFENNQIKIVKDDIQNDKQHSLENVTVPKTIIPQEKEEIKEGNVVLSPIVGTFYSSSSPSKPPFVKVGDKINEGDTLCIIEAMKVMNEIKSQFTGEIVEILVENEDMVEYNQPLFRII